MAIPRSLFGILARYGAVLLSVPCAFGQGAVAKPSVPNLQISSSDAVLDFAGYVQTRYTLNNRQDAPDDSEEWTSGFSNRRARLIMRGNLNKDLSYQVSGDAAAGTMRLVDAFGMWKASEQVAVRFGQLKMPFLREELINATRQLAVERSTANAVFTQDRSQGVEVGWTGQSTRVVGGFGDGLRTINTDFESFAEADYAITASAEFKWAGRWQETEQFTGFQGGAYAGAARIALHWQDGGETGGTIDYSNFSYTIDFFSKGDGWNTFIAFMGRRVDNTVNEFDDMGLVAQGGMFVAPETELFARYSLILPDDDRPNGDDFNEVTIGANYYLFPESHAAKITSDLTWALDEQAGSSDVVFPAVNNGLLAATDDQFYFRLQFQFIF